jgi:hypothetical protein
MSVPDQAQLLEAALHYLEHELLGDLQGEHRFKTRLAINALRIVQREQLVIGLPIAQREPEFELAQQIRAGDIALHDARLLQQLEVSLRQALSINNPKWLSKP